MAYVPRFPNVTAAEIVNKYHFDEAAEELHMKPFESHLCEIPNVAISDYWREEEYLREEVELCGRLLFVLPIDECTMDDRIALAERKALVNWWLSALY